MRDVASLSLLALLAPVALGAQAGAADSAARAARVAASLRTSTIEVEGRPPKAASIAERMANFKVPGVSVAVVEGGRIVWARGFGVKEAATADSVTAVTLFQAASISKPVAATATMRLVQQGTLDLDADVNRYLTSWKLPESRFTEREKVTLRRIMSHSAGLTVHGFPGYVAGSAVPTVAQVLDGAPPANTAPVRPDTFPGAVGRYSGGGVTIEQLVLTDVTRRPFPQLMRELVLVPAGMTRSTYEQPLPASREAEAARAHDDEGRPIAGRWHVYPEMAAAGLWTTPSDLLRWAMAIDASRRGAPGAILSRPVAAQMLTVQKEPFGLGPQLSGNGRTFRFEHGGANEGYRAQVVYFPETGQGAAVMTNGENGGPLANEIIRSIAAEYGWPALAPQRVTATTLDAATLESVVGEYDATFGETKARVRIARDGDRLSFEAPPVFRRDELVPLSPTSFVLPNSGFRVATERDASGRTTAFVVSRGPQSARATRVP